MAKRVLKAELVLQIAELQLKLLGMKSQRDNALAELVPLKRALHQAHVTRHKQEVELHNARTRIASFTRKG